MSVLWSLESGSIHVGGHLETVHTYLRCYLATRRISDHKKDSGVGQWIRWQQHLTYAQMATYMYSYMYSYIYKEFILVLMKAPVGADASVEALKLCRHESSYRTGGKFRGWKFSCNSKICLI